MLTLIVLWLYRINKNDMPFCCMCGWMCRYIWMNLKDLIVLWISPSYDQKKCGAVIYHCTRRHCCALFYSFPLSTADTRRFSVEENEAPHSGKIHRCYHHHGYEKQEALCLTTAKPSESKTTWLDKSSVFHNSSINNSLYWVTYILETCLIF